VLGSVPLISSRSRSASGASAATIRLSGHSTPCIVPPEISIVGRFAWKSKNSSGSIRATISVSNVAPSAPSAVPAALAASFHPEKEATSTGVRNSGGSRSQTIGSIGSHSSAGRSPPSRRPGSVRRDLHDRGIDEAAANPAAAPSPEAIAALQPGRPLAGRFAVVRKDRQQAKNGSPYLSLELRDRTGSIPARVFRDVDVIGSRFERGDAVEVRGKVERFRGRLTAEVTALRRIEPGSFDPAEFLPSAYRSTEELNGFLEHLTREIYDDGLREVVERVLDTEPVASEFRRAPCTRAGHHAYLGGLLEHTVSVGTLVGEVCQLHPKLDSDLLMAAALLHDVGKAREFTYGAEFGISDEGEMLGHLAIGASLIEPAATRLEPPRRLALLHCVLTHHGPEAAGRARGGGSGFASAEALALARINALDASVKGALEHGLR
jgi:3'-5' exoribonuclease